MKKALLYGLLASLFFAFTFFFNRLMHLSGGYWMWSACLRFLIMLPCLALMLAVLPGDRFGPLMADIKRQPVPWFLWSTVGFGAFYLPLTAASAFGQSWWVAASWEVTIVAGALITPLFGKKIPLKNLCLSLVVLAGVLLLQVPTETGGGDTQGSGAALLLILIAAFSYPLGNRKMMQYCPPEINAFQRLFGMTLCSTPLWVLTALIAWLRAGPPSGGQLIQSGAVALFSGIVATALFFCATDMVRDHPGQLAVIEATQCGEIIFTLLGGIFLLGDSVPGVLGFVGLALIIGGMVLNSLVAAAN